MPLLYISSKINVEKFSESINAIREELLNLPNFKNSRTTINFDEKILTVTILTEDEERLNFIMDALKSVKINDFPSYGVFNFKEDYSLWGKRIKKEIRAREGINKEHYKKIKTILREYPLRINIQLLDDFIRVKSKSFEHIHYTTVILHARKEDIGIPLRTRYL